MIEHLAVAIVSAIAFLGAILLYGAFSPRRLEGWKFWLCFAAYCVLMEGNGFLANELFSVCGAVGDGVGRQTLYNVIRYALLYALLFRERPVIYLSVTVIFYSWACCIENLVVGAILIFQDDAIRLAVEYHERGWLIWINELLILCGCSVMISTNTGPAAIWRSRATARRSPCPMMPCWQNPVPGKAPAVRIQAGLSAGTICMKKSSIISPSGTARC